MAKQDSEQFEKSLEALNQLVAKMEQGELSLEAALEHFEKGIKLSKSCQEALTKAEQKIETLMADNDKNQNC